MRQPGGDYRPAVVIAEQNRQFGDYTARVIIGDSAGGVAIVGVEEPVFAIFLDWFGFLVRHFTSECICYNVRLLSPTIDI